jgi:hypothetical protein
MSLKSYVSIPQIRYDGSIYYVRIDFDELIKEYMNKPIREPIPEDDLSYNFKRTVSVEPDYF